MGGEENEPYSLTTPHSQPLCRSPPEQPLPPISWEVGETSTGSVAIVWVCFGLGGIYGISGELGGTCVLPEGGGTEGHLDG